MLAGANDDIVRELLSVHRPEFATADVVPCGEGQDHVAFDVNGELIVRFRKEAGFAERAALVAAEARLLDEIADALPVAVPTIAFVDATHGCLAYRKLPGTPLLQQPRTSRAAWAETTGEAVGRSLAAMHALPPARMAAFVGTQPVARLVFSHSDLGIEHILIDPRTGTVTGIIDWSDAAMVDPAYDVGLLYRDLGPAALDAILRSELGAGDDSLRERPCSMRDAASSRTLRMDRTTAGRSTSTRVSPHSVGCSSDRPPARRRGSEAARRRRQAPCEPCQTWSPGGSSR